MRMIGLVASAVAEFMEALIGDSEMVCDLVNDCDPDLVNDLFRRMADAEDRQAVDGYPVWQGTGIPLTSFGERDSVVEPEQVLAGRWPISNLNHHVVYLLRQLLGDRIQRHCDQIFEDRT